MDGYLAKPIDVNQLIATVERIASTGDPTGPLGVVGSCRQPFSTKRRHLFTPAAIENYSKKSLRCFKPTASPLCEP